MPRPAEPRRAPPLGKQLAAAKRESWRKMTVEQARAHVLERVLAGETQTSLSERFGVSLSLINLRLKEAYREGDTAARYPHLMNQSRANPFRFWDFVVPEPNSGCWIYFGGDNGHGYGSYGRRGGHKRQYAHRIAYEQIIGQIPAGLELDHKCNTRCCCNPDHLEPVTHAVNQQRALQRGAVFDTNSRKTHCRSGHPFSGANLVIKTRRDGRTYRACRECERAAGRKHDANKRGRK